MFNRINLRKILQPLLLTLIFSGVSPFTLAGDDDKDGELECKKAKGNLSVVNNGDGTTSGTITKGGKLNGTTQAVFTSDLSSTTPDPNTFSYTDIFSITTKKGLLVANNVGLFDIGSGLFSEIARIDSSASTGRFAAASGVLYINGNTNDGGVSFEAKISGEICFNDD